MNNVENQNPRKIMLGIAIGIIAILVLFFVYQRTNRQQTPLLQVSTDQLQASETPVGLPADMPVEPGTKVLQNYISTTNDGRMQSTKQITSRKSPKEALDFYADFFKKAGWEGGLSQPVESQDPTTPLTAQFKNSIGDLVIVARPYETDQTSVEFTLIQSTK